MKAPEAGDVNRMKVWSSRKTIYTTIQPFAKYLLAATASQAYVDRVFSLCGLLSTWWRNRMSQPLEIREFLKLIDASIKCSRICKPHTITVTYDLHIHF